jgi:hypothetical protein
MATTLISRVQKLTTMNNRVSLAPKGLVPDNWMKDRSLEKERNLEFNLNKLFKTEKTTISQQSVRKSTF